MGTHLPGFQSIISFLHHFVLAKLATTRIRVMKGMCGNMLVCAKHYACSTNYRPAMYTVGMNPRHLSHK